MELILPFQNYPHSQQSPKRATKKKFHQGLLWRVSIFQLRQTQMQEDTTTSPKSPHPWTRPAATALLLIVTAPRAVTVEGPGRHPHGQLVKPHRMQR